MTYCNSFIQKPGCASLTINPDHIWHYQVRLADETPPIYAGFLKCAEHIHCVFWCVYFFVEIAETLKQLESWYYVLLQQQVYLWEQEPFYFFLLHLDIDMIPRPFFCLFLGVVLLIYRLFACYLFWPSIPHPVPKSPSKNRYIFNLHKSIWIASHSPFTKLI